MFTLKLMVKLIANKYAVAQISYKLTENGSKRLKQLYSKHPNIILVCRLQVGR